jgi:hypothetical protein
MKGIFIIVLAAILLAGCSSQQAAENKTVEQKNETAPPAQNGTAQGTGQIIEAPPGPGPSDTTTAPPPSVGGTATQNECSTLSSGCGACIAKAGCGWCKSTNGCYTGDSSGPTADVQCQPGDWAVTEDECQAPTGTAGSTCGEQPNCAFCLSGSGCKWCIQGTRCVPADSTDDCFGGWLTQSYQCNYASR